MDRKKQIHRLDALLITWIDLVDRALRACGRRGLHDPDEYGVVPLDEVLSPERAFGVIEGTSSAPQMRFVHMPRLKV